MKINPNTTIVDLSFNLSGSLAGVPALLSQLPTGERLGWGDGTRIPFIWEDVDTLRYGQTWTPTLAGLDVELSVPVYNTEAVNKAPYTTDLQDVEAATAWGNRMLEVLGEGSSWIPFTELGFIPDTEQFKGLRFRVFAPESPALLPDYPNGAWMTIEARTYDGDYSEEGWLDILTPAFLDEDRFNIITFTSIDPELGTDGDGTFYILDAYPVDIVNVDGNNCLAIPAGKEKWVNSEDFTWLPLSRPDSYLRILEVESWEDLKLSVSDRGWSFEHNFFVKLIK